MKTKTAVITALSISPFITPVLLQASEEPAIVEYSVRTPIQRRNLKLGISGSEYYVALNGSDANPGTKDKPFKTIQHCADLMEAGDICLVRAGTYREIVRPKNGGRKGDPIRYAAYPGEKVVLSGTEPVSNDWKPRPPCFPEVGTSRSGFARSTWAPGQTSMREPNGLRCSEQHAEWPIYPETCPPRPQVCWLWSLSYWQPWPQAHVPNRPERAESMSLYMPT